MASQILTPRPQTVEVASWRLGIAVLPPSSMRSKTGLQPRPCLRSYRLVNSLIHEPQYRRLSGARGRRSCSFQRIYTVFGLAEVISSAGVKSEWVRERITVSVRIGCNGWTRLPQQERSSDSRKSLNLL